MWNFINLTVILLMWICCTYCNPLIQSWFTVVPASQLLSTSNVAITQQIQHIEPMMFQSWPTVLDSQPTTSIKTSLDQRLVFDGWFPQIDVFWRMWFWSDQSNQPEAPSKCRPWPTRPTTYVTKRSPNVGERLTQHYGIIGWTFRVGVLFKSGPSLNTPVNASCWHNVGIT